MYYQLGKCASMAVSTMVGSLKKKSYAIWYFAFEEAQEINLQGNLQGSKYDGDFIFLRALFSFYEKVPSPLESIGFFQNIFTATISF